jgi:RNA polymerase sigma factor (sigma-70 family)
MNSQPIEQTSSWLFRVARNRIIDQYRKKHSLSLQNEILTETSEGELRIREILLADEPDAGTLQLRNLFWEELFSALDEIPEEQRQVFILNELEDIPFQEIAEKTGEKINTLISRKRYAVLHLRKRLELLYKEIIEQ